MPEMPEDRRAALMPLKAIHVEEGKDGHQYVLKLDRGELYEIWRGLKARQEDLAVLIANYQGPGSGDYLSHLKGHHQRVGKMLAIVDKARKS